MVALNSRWLLVLYLFVCGLLQAQEKNELIKQRIEFIAEQMGEEEIDLTNVVEDLYYYYDHPIALNSAKVEDLRQLGLLTDIQIQDLLRHRKNFGDLITIYELQSLPYWDIETIKRVLPFIRVDDRFENVHINWRDLLKGSKQDLFLRGQWSPESRKGYTKVSDSLLNQSSSYYHGDPYRLYTRYRMSYRNNFSIGFTGDKDAGETFEFNSSQKGFDFYSGHAFYRGGKYLRAVALGDYHVQVGQGLNIWTSYAFNKTADVSSIKKNAQSLKPYTSADEYRFLRGAAMEWGYKKWALTLFGSHKRVDGSVVMDSLSQEASFYNSINISGYHRTTSERKRKNAFGEWLYGGNLRFVRGLTSVGIAHVEQGYTATFAKEMQPYNQFDFRGNRMASSSVDFSSVWRNFSFFGESAFQWASRKSAHLMGMLVALDKSVDWSLLYRNYDRAYQTFYSQGFSEGNNTQNEKGLFTGLNWRLNNFFTLQTYADVFRFPWLKYLIDAPSSGREFLVQPAFRPNKTFEIYVRYRDQVREKNARFTDGTVTRIEPIRQRNYRLHLSMTVAEGIQLRSRFEYVTVQRPSNSPEQGYLIYQDVVYRPKHRPFDLSLRYALFQTDSYDSRIYAYESNALYVFSIPGYYYHGSRAYFLFRWTLKRGIDLWFRYARNIYTDRMKLGSGAEEINGNVKSEFLIQLRFQF